MPSRSNLQGQRPCRRPLVRELQQLLAVIVQLPLGCLGQTPASP